MNITKRSDWDKSTDIDLTKATKLITPIDRIVVTFLPPTTCVDIDDAIVRLSGLVSTVDEIFSFIEIMRLGIHAKLVKKLC